MPLYSRNLFYLIIFLFSAKGLHAQLKPEADYGLAFASHEATKDHRTSLSLNPETPFHIEDDFEIVFGLSFQRLTNAYGYVLRIIANDSLNIDLVSSPEHEEFYDLNLITNNARTDLHYNFNDIGLKPSQWTRVSLSFSYQKNQITFSWGDQTKTHDFAVSGLRKFRFYFGANDFGRFNTSDVPPMSLKDIAIRTNKKIIAAWDLKQHHVDKVYDGTANRVATVRNPQWLIDKHRKWIFRKDFVIGKYPSIAFDGPSGILYAIDDGHLYTYNIASGTVDEKKNKAGNPVFTDANQLLYVEELDKLINYDLHANKFVPYNPDESSWLNNDTAYNEPNYWHNNKFYNPIDRSLYTFGGYGHFSYKNTFSRYDEKGRRWVKAETTGSIIAPRYLSASGMTPSRDKVYIFGGYGSLSGKQELSPQSFYDLSSFDLRTHQVKKIWEFQTQHSTEDIVFSNSLIINEKDSCFYVMSYPKNKYEGYCKLRRYSLSRPESVILADSIPFHFHDEHSFTDLFHSEATKELIVVTVHKEKDQYKANVYAMNYPPLTTSEVLQQDGSKPAFASFYYFLIFTGLLSLALAFAWIRRNRKRTFAEKVHQSEKVNPSVDVHYANGSSDSLKSSEDHKVRSSIHLFGGFQIFDKSGNDITGKFTMTLKELFALILLHSVKYEKGISAIVLQDILWPEKDEVSARNNRNVNIKKLRSLLKEIGNLTIENNSSYLKLAISNEVYCDYQTVSRILDNVEARHLLESQHIEVLLKNVKRGSLLPNLQTFWVDQFKSDISNRVIDTLLEYSQKLDTNKDDKVLLEIADAIFNYDTINQEALVIKCSVLNKKGKYSLARTWYDHFAKEYRHLYSENYPKTFDEVIA